MSSLTEKLLVRLKVKWEGADGIACSMGNVCSTEHDEFYKDCCTNRNENRHFVKTQQGKVRKQRQIAASRALILVT